MFSKLINWPITISILLLSSIGILVIFSSSTELALQQVLFLLLGFVIYFFISQTDYRFMGNLINPLYVITVFLLILILILGFETRGAIRWIPLGFINIQPSELAKPVLLLSLSYFWSIKLPTWVNIFKSILYLLPILFLVFRQPDLGTTLTLFAIWAGLLFLAKISVKKLFLLLLIGFLTIPIFWFTLRDFQKERITNFLSPGKDPLGLGYNLIQSTIAVGSGNMFGRGLGRGTQSRLQFLPEYRTDFIFAAISEEMGFLGSLLIITIYIYLISYCLRVAAKSKFYLGYLIASGVAVMIAFQASVNIGMNIGILPITGITLPLISYGGSSIISTLISLGLVSSVSRYVEQIDI